MVVIHKDWQALPVSTTTVSIPNTETHIPLDNIQQPTTHISSEPDIVELHKIKHNEPIEPWAVNNIYSNAPLPVVVKPKKKLWIIQQKGLLDQFSFNSSSLMIGAGLLFLVSAGKGQVNKRISKDSLSGFY